MNRTYKGREKEGRNGEKRGKESAREKRKESKHI
jgi:hypothetical protein